MPSCGHIRVLKIIHSLELLTRLEVQCGLGNSVGIKMFFHNFAMKCSNLNSRNNMYYCRLCVLCSVCSSGQSGDDVGPAFVVWLHIVWSICLVLC